MKNLFRPLSLAFLAVTISFTSCTNDDNLLGNTGNEQVELKLPNNKNPYKEITAEAGEIVDVRVIFEQAKNPMYRLYVSQNEYGSDLGTVAYDINKVAVNVDTKRDGSIDLNPNEKQGFTKTLPLLAPKDKDGVVVYNIWATSGGILSAAKGDFRDMSKNNAYNGDAHITVKIIAGTPKVEATQIKKFSARLLAAPLADGRSETFMSVYNGQKYAIKGAEDTATLWDFGYYYGKTDKASFASVNGYPSKIVDVKRISGINKLNNFYIAKSNLDFNNVTLTDLKNIQQPTKEEINHLNVGDVLEFVDAYGTKGLIKITNIVNGYGSNGKIEFDIKVQDTSIKL